MNLKINEQLVIMVFTSMIGHSNLSIPLMSITTVAVEVQTVQASSSVDLFWGEL